MKTAIHPKWYPKAKVTCACGNSFVSGSTKPSIQVEVCSNCHPFYTGQMKFVDTAGRVEKFKTRQSSANVKRVSKTEKRRIKQEKRIKEELSRPDSLEQLRNHA